MDVADPDKVGLLALLLRLNSSEQTLTLTVEDCVKTLGANYSIILETNPSLERITCQMHAPTFRNIELVKTIVLAVLATLSLIGNVCTMCCIRKSRKKGTGHIYNLLYHLALADLFVTCWCMLGDAVWYATVDWRLGNVECKLFKYAQMFSLYLSTFIMVLIGVDRYIAVKYPLKSMSKGTCFKLVIFCWVLSAVLSSPQLVVFNVQAGPFQEPFYQCVTYGSYSSEWQEQLYSVFTVAFTFVIPLSIIGTTYILTVYTLQRNEDFIDDTGTFATLINPNRRKIIRRAKMKSLRISVAIVVAFVVCWTPYYMAMLHTFVTRTNGQDPADPDNILFTVVFFFGVSNSLLNPMIFAGFHLWKPRRNELQRGSSSRRTFFANLSFHRRRSTMLVNENGLNVPVEVNECGQQIKNGSHNNNLNGETPIVKAIIKWSQGSGHAREENTVI